MKKDVLIKPYPSYPLLGLDPQEAIPHQGKPVEEWKWWR